MWYRYRRNSRGMGYLWFLFIPLFFFAGHGILGILLWLAAIVALNLIGRAIFAAIAGNANTRSQWYQPYQQPYQPNQYQQPHQSYQQGYQQPYYQPRPETYQAGQQQYPTSQQQYDQYEQPRAEYPQELPPMQH